MEYGFHNESGLIIIGSIGWKTETVEVLVNVSSENIFGFYVDAERVKGDCCVHTRFNKTRIDHPDFEFDSETGIYKIQIDK